MMKTLNDYLDIPYTMEIVPDKSEGGYVASFPELPGCVTCGETVEAAFNAIEAKKEWITAALEDGIDVPNCSETAQNYSGQFKLRLPKSPTQQEELVGKWRFYVV